MVDADFNSPVLELANASSRFSRDLRSVERNPEKDPITLAVTLAATLAVNCRLP